jgi:streptogramin lyase
MNRLPRLALATLLALVSAAVALAHPGAGIALDRQGNVYFVDTGAGVWRLDPEGRLTPYGGPAFHWMALDLDDRFGRAPLPSTPESEMRTSGSGPTVVLSSDFPIAIDGDGALFHAEPTADGTLSLVRTGTDGGRTVRARLPAASGRGPLRWLNGIAAGTDGAILFTADAALYRVAPGGAVTTVLPDVRVPACEAPPGYGEDQPPMLRGLAAAPDGTIWIAAAGCRALLRVAPAGTVSVALRAEAPWSPTDVAIGPAGAYVLEYLHTPGEDRRVWVPRVRLLGADGAARTLVTVRRDD